MYLIKIDTGLMSELWKIREENKLYGIKTPISKQVNEAVTEYVTSLKKNN